GSCLVFASPAASAKAQTATCERGPITDGSGPADWRQKSVVAGPLSVFRRPLRQMSETSNGQLIAKMPVLTARGAPVKLSVPTRLQHRVFLYYGRMQDRNGEPTTLIGKAKGFGEVVFEPCEDRPRTAWPGGIRIKGRKPVHLVVQVEGSPESIPLPLGRPTVFKPSTE
ncbi:MAG TPA: hypothetical protein VFW48_02510, partial [Solirubrobacterales bacterium]|nr:hypothetical protein [Solirubrobacterales bacterium]